MEFAATGEVGPCWLRGAKRWIGWGLLRDWGPSWMRPAWPGSGLLICIPVPRLTISTEGPDCVVISLRSWSLGWEVVAHSTPPRRSQPSQRAKLGATDYLHGQVCSPQGTLPVLAIPTTSGTGSELNRSAIVTDSDERSRVGIRDDCLFPRVAIVDPLLTCTLDAYQTACTGFDCLSHAIESYVSPKARPDTDQLALRAIQLVTQYLPAALADPLDILAREQLALASTTMGINLSCVGTCYPHRVDKALCALHPEILTAKAWRCSTPVGFRSAIAAMCRDSRKLPSS